MAKNYTYIKGAEYPYQYKYEHMAVTTDCVIFIYENRTLKVLLVRRGTDPFKGKWAFPGGFLKLDETAKDGAPRELREETALETSAILHDVVEDSDWTEADLYSLGFSKEVIDAIGLLTHSNKYEPYEEYIDRIIKSGNHLAIVGKMKDLRHNIARGKAGNHERLVQKHEAALGNFINPMFQ